MDSSQQAEVDDACTVSMGGKCQSSIHNADGILLEPASDLAVKCSPCQILPMSDFAHVGKGSLCRYADATLQSVMSGV